MRKLIMFIILVMYISVTSAKENTINMGITIKLLADFSAVEQEKMVNIIAKWNYDSWHKYDPAVTIERSIERFRERALNINKFPLTLVAFDEKAATAYGEIRAVLEKDGTPIDPLDLMIAAHAKSRRLTLVTNSTKEFFRVPDLLVENWVK